MNVRSFKSGNGQLSPYCWCHCLKPAFVQHCHIQILCYSLLHLIQMHSVYRIHCLSLNLPVSSVKTNCVTCAKTIILLLPFSYNSNYQHRTKAQIHLFSKNRSRQKWWQTANLSSQKSFSWKILFPVVHSCIVKSKPILTQRVLFFSIQCILQLTFAS